MKTSNNIFAGYASAIGFIGFTAFKIANTSPHNILFIALVGTGTVAATLAVSYIFPKPVN